MYDDYKSNGLEAEILNEAEYNRRIERNLLTNFPRIDVDGVYGLWCLDILRYAPNIHWTIDFMHSCNNVCHDMLNSTRPTHSGISGLYYEHSNRTYCDSVVAACKNEKIFPILESNLKPDWVLEVDECLSMDKAMGNILCQSRSEEIVKNVMRGGRAEKSHDTIYWCIVYARSDFIPIYFNIIHLM